MKRLKNFFILYIVLGLLFLISGCNINTNSTIEETNTMPTQSNTNEKDIVKFNIFSLNDLHGAIFPNEGEASLSVTGNFLMNEKKNNPDTTIILSGGDMFQGTAVSSMTRGAAICDIMNVIGFDAMAIGNHEFDWGVEQLLKLHDNNKENGEADFPFLAANIVYKDTKKQVEWSTPYEIIERSNVKIGIIGLIGENQINDILASIVAPFEFSDQVEAVKKYAKELREEKNCELIIVVTHDGGLSMDTTNEIEESIVGKLAHLTGSYRVDAILNAHTHRYYYGEYTVSGHTVPFVQSGNNGKYIGNIEIEYNKKIKEIVDISVNNITAKNLKNGESSEINNVLTKYQSYIDLSQSILAKLEIYYSRIDIAYWIAKAMMDRANCDVGIINFGGVRNSFHNEDISYGDVFQILPFENAAVKITMTGKQIKDSGFIDSGEVAFVSKYSDFEDNKNYNVCVIDYVFEKVSYQHIFSSAKNVVKTNEVVRDWIVEAIINKAKDNNDVFTLD